MHACMNVWMYVCMYKLSSPYRTWTSGDSATIWKPQIENQLHIHTRVLWMHVRWWFHLFIYEHHICMRTYRHTYILPSIIHIYTYLYIHTFIYILAYILIHTHTYILMQIILVYGDILQSLFNSYIPLSPRVSDRIFFL